MVNHQDASAWCKMMIHPDKSSWCIMMMHHSDSSWWTWWFVMVDHDTASWWINDSSSCIIEFALWRCIVWFITMTHDDSSSSWQMAMIHHADSLWWIMMMSHLAGLVPFMCHTRHQETRNSPSRAHVITTWNNSTHRSKRRWKEPKKGGPWRTQT